MKPQVKKFLDRLGNNEELKRKFHAASSKEKDDMVTPFLDGMSLSAFKQEITNIGNAVIQSKIESGELNKSDLSSISGGGIFDKFEKHKHGWDIGLGETVGRKFGGIFKKGDQGAQIGKKVTSGFAKLFCTSLFF